MDKTVYAGGALIAAALIAGSIFIPTSFVMVLASTSMAANIARGVIILLMIGLIVTNPLRSQKFRAVLGAASLGMLVYAWNHTMSGTIQLADSVLFLQAGIAFAIEALEPHTERKYKVAEAIDLDSLRTLRLFRKQIV